MAALSDRPARPGFGELTDLREIPADRLDPLLEEEIATWRRDLDWDFRPSADLVRRFVELESLNGFALVQGTPGGSRVAGYSYYVCEEGKGLIGDLYVRTAQRTVENENALIEAVLDAMWRAPGVRRVESQLMMLSAPFGRPVPFPERFHSYPRCFLEAPLAGVERFAPRELPGISISLWQENRQDDTARLIANSYQGHIDSRINDQYRSPGGARRFLTNIVQYPGCGTFYAPASYAAASLQDHSQCGVSLASLVAGDAGHITQVCVAPSRRGTGLGYELMRRSMVALAAHGCRLVSLTVTASNQEAIQLYEQMGFVNRRDFAAYVWEAR
jgi:ribosomal protein S18 acetylase RimI-like enzyme